jgi:IMP dehydrogenase
MSELDWLAFDDVLLEPIFSHVKSRQDVNPSSDFLGLKLSLPVTNSNMDTVASPELSKVLHDYGMVSSIHRFCTIEENVKLFQASIHNGIKPIVSVGVGEHELLRASKLAEAGAEIFLLDVAHAANILVVAMFQHLSAMLPNCKIIVGNFGTGKEIDEFIRLADRKPDAVCVGIGGGSMCLTRVVTGVGVPTLESIIDAAHVCERNDLKMMVNGGLRNSGDIVKALAAGADLIMLGSMFAGTDESSGKLCIDDKLSLDDKLHLKCGRADYCPKHKEYRGSASLSSYEAQGKVASWRSPEGDSTWVPLKGPAVNVLNQINGGIRSACSYLNAFNINEMRAHASFKTVTSNTVVENKAHGK